MNESPTNVAIPTPPEDLDLDYYRLKNKDIAHLSDRKLIEHWKQFGRKEKRVALPNLDFGLNLEFYQSVNQDLKGKIKNLRQAKLHWLNYGKEEKRPRFYSEYLEINEISPLINLSNQEAENVISLNSHISLTYPQLIAAIEGSFVDKPIRFTEDDKQNSDYFNLISSEMIKDIENVDVARHAAKIAIAFQQNGKSYELIGKTFFHTGDYESAAVYFQKAFIETSEPSDELIITTLETHKRLKEFERMYCALSPKNM